MEYSIKEGKLLIQLARDAIRSFFTGALMAFEPYKKDFSHQQGVFVTLFKDGFLRGSIGYPQSKYPLYRAVFYAARGAAFEDSRFAPLTQKEAESIEIEIGLISEPHVLTIKEPKEYLKKIHVGEDGLLMEGVYGKCALLPQVALDNKWGIKEFLSAVCTEAGLQPDAWQDLKNKFYTFTVQTFMDKNGKIVEKN